jgi:hypothetical protein
LGLGSEGSDNQREEKKENEIKNGSPGINAHGLYSNAKSFIFRTAGKEKKGGEKGNVPPGEYRDGTFRRPG